MSRSRRKPKAFMCGGRNTEFYRDRNRSTRNKNKHILRSIKTLNNNELDSLEFVSNKRNPDFDPWCEPTDGSFMAKEDDFKDDFWQENYYKKLCRK